MLNELQRAEENLFLVKREACKTLDERAIFVLEMLNNRHGYWKNLEIETGIASKRWRTVVARNQRITSDMIEVLCKKFPEYSHWIIFGDLRNRDLVHQEPVYVRVNFK